MVCVMNIAAEDKMMSADQGKPTKNYMLKPVTKPLPSQEQKTHANKDNAGVANTPQFRDITEDDDGYHPYADVPDNRPFFEDNPWR